MTSAAIAAPRPHAEARPLLGDLARPDRAIISPSADLVLFHGAPLWVLALCTAIVAAIPPENGYAIGTFNFVVAVITFAHLAPVFVRSHLNPTVFARNRAALTIVPVALFGLLATQHWAFIIAAVIGFFWDIYHSAQQNFGIARIYDAKAGPVPPLARRLDRMLAHLVYVGPIAAGASFVTHVGGMTSLKDLGWTAFATAPQAAEGVAGLVRAAALGLGAVGLMIYAAGYAYLMARGYRPSVNKIVFTVCTSAGCILAWGFSPPIVAFAAVNVFHALHYFALMWRMEGGKVNGYLGLKAPALPRLAPLMLIIGLPFAFGVAYACAAKAWTLAAAAFLTVSLLHFWMDGFIWSVRKPG